MLSLILVSAWIPALPIDESPPSFAIKAAHVVLADGALAEPGVVWVDGGKIRAVGASVELPAGLPLIEHDGWLTAGLVAAHTQSGILFESEDDTRSSLPEARLAFAFQAEHSDFQKALAAGITTLVLAPQSGNLIGGTTVVVKSAGGSVLDFDGHLAISLVTGQQRINRGPTSPGGALAQLRDELDQARGNCALAASGRLPVMIAATDRHDVLRATTFAREYKLRGTLLFAPLAGELAAEIKSAGLGVVLSQLVLGEPRRELDSVKSLASSDVPFAFALGAPFESPEGLRLSAVQAVRAGVDRTKALASITTVAAQISGVQDRVGSLARGLDADIVLWSGDPLDLASRPVGVWVDGVRRSGGSR